MTTTTKGLSGINVLLGIWLVVSPFLFGATAASAWNLFIVGAAIAIVAGFNFFRTTQGREVVAGASGVVAVLGLWMAISPFMFVYNVAMAWNVVIVGLLVLAFGAYNAYESSRVPEPRRV
jgi:hypothetical protein